MQARPPVDLDALRWDDVRVFLALYRAKTLAGAGKRLGFDASTASRRLAALEAALGVRLFDRTRDGLLATHAAEQLAPAAEEGERGVLKFARSADALEAAVEGVVRITAPPGVIETFVAPVVVRLIARHPALRIELDATARVVDLSRREADLALRLIRPSAGDLVMTRLLAARARAFASRGYARELGTVRDWAAPRWIAWGAEFPHVTAAQWLARHAPGVEPVLRASSAGAQLAAVESGLGVAIVSDPVAAARGLVPVATTRALAARTEWPTDLLYLVAHRAMREVPRIAATWDFLVEETSALARRAEAGEEQ